MDDSQGRSPRYPRSKAMFRSVDHGAVDKIFKRSRHFRTHLSLTFDLVTRCELTHHESFVQIVSSLD